ncbi:MAG: hypothetical protein JEZ02_09135, partial [Desulfatibacillum sp.]|nr:hypothetical protein [Desulfatibacillum sp.]
MKRIWLFTVFCVHLSLVFGLFAPLTAQAADVTPMVAVSNSYTVALKADGTVWSWGQGGSGEMGNGVSYVYETVVYPPVQASISDVKYIAIGNSATYAIKTDGTLWSWGWNASGELGVGDTESRNLPVQITGLSNIIQVSGSNGGCAVCLKDDGTVYAWGYNYYGEVGNGSTTMSIVPVLVTATDFTDIRAIDSGANHVVARKGDGTVWTWGRNDTKQCGRGAQTRYTSPGQVTTTGVQDIIKV